MVETDKQCYYSDFAEIPLRAALGGIGWLLQRAEGGTGIAYLSSLSTLQKNKTLGMAISKQYGEIPLEELRSPMHETVIRGARVRLISNSNRIEDAENSPLLAYHPKLSDLEWLDAIRNVPQMLLIS